MKYKVGDKVRVITDLHKGLIGKITEVDDSSSVPYKVTFYESKINDNWYCWYFEKSLEPVQEKSTDFSKNSAIIEYKGKKYDVALSIEKDDCSILIIKEHKEVQNKINKLENVEDNYKWTDESIGRTFKIQNDKLNEVIDKVNN